MGAKPTLEEVGPYQYKDFNYKVELPEPSEKLERYKLQSNFKPLSFNSMADTIVSLNAPKLITTNLASQMPPPVQDALTAMIRNRLKTIL